MKLKVNSFLLLPQALLPPCFLEIFICILRLRVTAASRIGRSPKSAHWNTSTAQTSGSFLQQHKNLNICCISERKRKKSAAHFKKLTALLWTSGEQRESLEVCPAVRQWVTCISTGHLNTVPKLSEGHWKRDILSPSHFSFCEATHNTKLIKASTLRKRNVPFGKFRNSWLVLSITFVLTSVELIQLSLFMKLSFLCYLIATNCCNYISELQIFCTDKNFDCLSATHKEKITSAKWGVPRLDNNA